MANGKSPYDLETVIRDIRNLYGANPGNAEALIEDYLLTVVEGVSDEDAASFIEEVGNRLQPQKGRAGPFQESETGAMANLLALLLGRRISNVDLSSPELSRKLASALNTVFDNLNDLVAVIQTTLLGEDPSLQTIRHLISEDIRGEGESRTLEEYLRQIKEAFLVASQAFKAASRTEIAKILDELDPDPIVSEAEKGAVFGFMRKGEFLELYRERYERINKWFHSERSSEEFVREFERACQQIYKEKGGLHEKK